VVVTGLQVKYLPHNTGCLDLSICTRRLVSAWAVL